jgi:hypothetical protein
LSSINEKISSILSPLLALVSPSTVLTIIMKNDIPPWELSRVAPRGTRTHEKIEEIF